MIVNPQLLNYRIIIGALIIVISALSVYSFTSQKSIEFQQQFLEQEHKLVEVELDLLSNRFTNISTSETSISNELEDTKYALDSIKAIKDNNLATTNIRQQLASLQLKNRALFKNNDSLHQVNSDLEKENKRLEKTLQAITLENSSLLANNIKLKEGLEKGGILTANSFNAKAFEIVLDHKNETDKAKRVNLIEVCFTLAENVLAEAGKKDIYIQILNPKNNVIADKGSANFGSSSLIYSAKKNLVYNTTNLDACIDIEADTNDIPLEAGVYYISIFHQDKKLGSTRLTLE